MINNSNIKINANFIFHIGTSNNTIYTLFISSWSIHENRTRGYNDWSFKIYIQKLLR